MVTTLMWGLKKLSYPVITGGQSAASIAFDCVQSRCAPFIKESLAVSNALIIIKGGPSTSLALLTKVLIGQRGML